MLTAQYFSADYAEARQKFLHASCVAGACVESFQNPCSGQGGVELFTDLALLGPSDAENVLVLIS